MKRFFQRIFFILFLSAIMLLGYKVYRAFYPNDDFYIKEFITNTGIALPNSVLVKAKSATFPDVHGSFTAIAIIILPEEDFIKVKTLVSSKQQPKFAALAGKYLMDTESFFESAGILPHSIDSHWIIAEKHQIKIAFLKDNKTIVFERHSS